MNHIILIGFMGAGKTTLGRRLAKRMNLKFIDTDDYVEARAGKKISDIFAEQGEACFRQMETDALRQLMKSAERCVIAVGGGLPVLECNRRLLKQLGTVVYLQTDIETLLNRLQGDTKRPKLQGGGLREKIEGLMAQRKEIYEETADAFVRTDHRSYEEILQEIQESAARKL
ncbi:MAG: shikimate kinase [Lachnospiraceae bacterium]|nr:shikimate kinase [Lachnospiraceae bacterium]MDD3796369.1 shikimate kinase [Lachnospiraceae bacterium]